MYSIRLLSGSEFEEGERPHAGDEDGEFDGEPAGDCVGFFGDLGLDCADLVLLVLLHERVHRFVPD